MASNYIAIILVLSVLLGVTLTVLVALFIITITLGYRLRTKSSESKVTLQLIIIISYHLSPLGVDSVAPAVLSSYVIDANHCFGDEEKDAYIEQSEEML